MNPIKQIQRNHALEHATVHILSNLQPGLRLMGRTDYRGFWLYGRIDTHLVRQAVSEGLLRLQNDESWLAVHPKCGTNIAVAALVASAAVYTAQALAERGAEPSEHGRSAGRSWLGKAATAAISLGSAMALAQPLGLLAQQHITTAPDLDGVSLRDISRQDAGGMVIHRVLLTHES